MGNQRMEAEDQETLIRSPYNPYALYFVQSPSTPSHTTNLYHVHHHAETLPLHLRYSSRGSNFSYLHEKKLSYDYHADNDDDNGLIDEDDEFNDNEDHDDDEFEEEEEEEEKGLVRFLSFSTHPSSTLWMCLQILWRLGVSLGVALLVFYIATKPPPPRVSLEIAKIGAFRLGEGTDATGVTTKLLTINCSINLLIKNKSKFFGLHVQSPAVTMSFGHLPLAISYGPNNMYARSDGSTIFQLILATKNKPMYGGGIAMQDMLDINKGLPLVVHLRMKSNFRVIWGLINPKFPHGAECLLLLGRDFDKKHHTQKYKSRCLVTSY